MAKIIISDLVSPNSEIFLNSLTDVESQIIFGGRHSDFSEYANFGLKALQFFAVMATIDAITLVSTSFK